MPFSCSARAAGAGHHLLLGLLPGVAVKPPPFRAAPGIFGWIGSVLTDATSWRAVLYLLLKAPLGLAISVATLAIWLMGAFAVAYPLWSATATYRTDGQVHRGSVGIGGFVFDTWPRVILLVLVGALVLLAAPWLTRALLWPDLRLARALLGPTRAARLRHARAVVANDAEPAG